MADPGNWSLAQDRWRENQTAVRIQSYQADFITLDRFMKVCCAIVPDFVKIDVEGAELLVLQGAKDFFAAGHRPLMLLEIFAPWEKAFHYQPWAPLSLLLSYGYEILFICPVGAVKHRPTLEQPFPVEYEAGYNIIAYQPQLHQSRIKARKVRSFVESLNRQLSLHLLPGYLPELNPDEWV